MKNDSFNQEIIEFLEQKKIKYQIGEHGEIHLSSRFKPNKKSDKEDNLIYFGLLLSNDKDKKVYYYERVALNGSAIKYEIDLQNDSVQSDDEYDSLIAISLLFTTFSKIASSVGLILEKVELEFINKLIDTNYKDNTQHTIRSTRL